MALPLEPGTPLGKNWKRTAPDAEVMAADWLHFHPDRIPDGPGRDLVQAVMANPPELLARRSQQQLPGNTAEA